MPTSIFEFRIRHTGESRYPESKAPNRLPWIPACAEMTEPHGRDAETDDRRRGQGARLRRRPASPPPTPLQARAMRSTSFSPRAGRATWPGSPARRSAARPRARCGRKRSSVILLGLNYGRAGDPLAILQAAIARRDLDLCARRRLSRRAQGEAQAARRARAGAHAKRGEAVRRYRAGDGEAARRARRARLAGQAHQPRVARVRLVAVHRLDLHHRRDRARRARGGSLRGLPPLPRHLPDARLHRALPDRCARLHLLPHHRA